MLGAVYALRSRKRDNFLTPPPTTRKKWKGVKTQVGLKMGGRGQEPIFVKVYMILAQNQQKVRAPCLEMPCYNLVFLLK